MIPREPEQLELFEDWEYHPRAVFEALGDPAPIKFEWSSLTVKVTDKFFEPSPIWERLK